MSLNIEAGRKIVNEAVKAPTRIMTAIDNHTLGRMIRRSGVAALFAASTLFSPSSVTSAECQVPEVPKNMKADVLYVEGSNLLYGIYEWDRVEGTTYDFRVNDEVAGRLTQAEALHEPYYIMRGPAIEDIPPYNGQFHYAAWVHAVNSCGASTPAAVRFDKSYMFLH